MTKDQIKAEFDAFIEFPGDDKRYVTTVSTILFAEHIARMVRAQALREAREVCEADGFVEQFRGLNEAVRRIKQLEGK